MHHTITDIHDMHHTIADIIVHHHRNIIVGVQHRDERQRVSATALTRQ